MVKRKETTNAFRLILIGVLLLIATFLIISKPNLREKKIFGIDDKCGKFVNLMSHTIEDEAACKSRCRAQCIATEYEYSRVEFEKSYVECNSCTCFCK